MKKASVWTSFSLCVAVVMLLGGAAGAQQKYRFSETTESGDVASVDKQVKVVLQLQVPQPGQPARDAMASFGEREQYRETILAFDPKGNSRSLRRAYGVARHFEMDPAGDKKETVSSLQGKTISIRIVGGKATVTCDKGKLAAADVKSLKSEVLGQPDAPSFFPDHEVAVGEEWQIDGAKLAASFGQGVQKATAKAHFEEVEDFAGHPCARVHLDLDVVAQPEGLPSALTFQLAGDVHYAIDLRRTVDATLAGPLQGTFKAGEDQPSIPISGDATFHWTERWLKVAGKPVVEKHSPAGAPAEPGTAR